MRGMKREKRILQMLALVGAMTFGAQCCAAGRNIVDQSVTSVGTGWGAEGIYVTTAADAPVADGCGGLTYLIESTHPMWREMVALLLSALHTGGKVYLYVDGCVNSSAMKLKAVALIK